MDCRSVEFSPEKSEERIKSALRVFPSRALMRVLAFALYLLGAQRKALAGLVGMPEESVKTVVRLAMRDGFPALADRRLSGFPAVSRAVPIVPIVSVRREGEHCVIDFGQYGKSLSIPIAHRVQMKTVLLSMVIAELLAPREAAAALNISAAHCRELAGKLTSDDVIQSLVDKRQGQKHDYRVGSEQKAEIIQQLSARIITGRSASSEVLAEEVKEHTQVEVSARTVRWHIRKLGLANIRETLPQLVDALKKTPDRGS